MDAMNKLRKYLEEAYNEAQTIRGKRHDKALGVATNMSADDMDTLLLCGMAMGRVATLEEMKAIVEEISDGEDK